MKQGSVDFMKQDDISRGNFEVSLDISVDFDILWNNKERMASWRELF
jgi:hypothetical protein